MNAAITQLRTTIINKEDGAFLGSEQEVQKELGISRTTLRQVARLLEREGILAVKRGASGGYYACRPSLGSIESAVTSYLAILDVHAEELSTMASIIWIEAVRHASSLRNEAATKLAGKLVKIVNAVSPTITHRDLSLAEQRIRADVFGLIDLPYMWLIFQINIRIARTRFGADGGLAAEPEQMREFVSHWRSTKLLELEAIARGDQELGVLAAQRTRQIWRSMVPNDNVLRASAVAK